jgi:predicted nucleic acid-binding protein
VIVVADASPLIALERIGQLSLLIGMVGQVANPRAVLGEILQRGPGLAQALPA